MASEADLKLFDDFVLLRVDDLHPERVEEGDVQQAIVERNGQVIGPAVHSGSPQDVFGFGADGDDFARFGDVLVSRAEAVVAIDVQNAAVMGRGHVVEKGAQFDRADDLVAGNGNHRHVAAVGVLHVGEFGRRACSGGQQRKGRGDCRGSNDRVRLHGDSTCRTASVFAFRHFRCRRAWKATEGPFGRRACGVRGRATGVARILSPAAATSSRRYSTSCTSWSTPRGTQTVRTVREPMALCLTPRGT